MSIASEITRISDNVADAYTAANAKGATMPISQNSDNLATTIATIPTGTTPTGIKNITANGVYDVTDFASADVQVPTTAPEIYRVFRVNNGKVQHSINTPFLPLPNTATDIDEYIYYYCYADTPSSTLSGTIDLSSLTKITGASACSFMFYNCPGITSVDLSNLSTTSGAYSCSNMFRNCTGITNVNLSSLTSSTAVSGFSNMFQGCTSLTSVNLSSLTALHGNNAFQSMFYGCTALSSVDLSGLQIINSNNCLSSCFQNCTSLTSLSFPSLKSVLNSNVFSNMVAGVTGCTIHFPSNLSSYAFNCGGTNTTVLFDLPATE